MGRLIKMKNKAYLLNTLLAIVVGIAMLAIVLLRTFLPQMIIPRVSIPNMVLLSLVALVLEHLIAKGADRCYICIPVFAAITFGLLPWVAGYIPAGEIWKLAVGGGVTFTVTTFLFSSICERLSSGPVAKAAPFISAVGLYFAAQCLTGIIF